MIEIDRGNAASLKCGHSTCTGVLTILMLLIISCIPAPAQDDSADYWMSRGSELEGNGSYEEAAKAYGEALKMDSENATIWFYKGNALYSQAIGAGFNMSIFEDALKAYGHAINLSADYSLPWWGKSRTLNLMASRQSGEVRDKTMSDAVYAIEMAVRIDSTSVDAWLFKGSLLSDLARSTGNISMYNDSFQALDIAIDLAALNDTRNLALAWDGKALGLTYMSNDLDDAGREDEARPLREDALEYYDKAIDLDPDFTGMEARINKAAVLEELGRYDEAISILREAIETAPPDIPQYSGILWADLGSVLETKGDHDEALSALDNATNLDPGNEVAWKTKARVLRSLSLSADADAALARAEELRCNASAASKCDTLEGCIAQGNELSLNGSTDEALCAFKKAIDLDPESVEAWTRKGYALTRLAFSNNESFSYDESLAAFEKATTLNSSYASAWSGKGSVLSTLGRYEDSLEAYNISLELDPQQTWIHVGKANALWKLGQYNESMAAYDEAVLTAQDIAEKAFVWFEKAHLFAEYGDYNRTIEALRNATDLAPEDKEIWFGGGVLLSAHLGRYNESITFYERAVDIDSQDGSLWHSMGISLEAAGHEADADQAYAKAEALGYEA